jgi:hypothetical protein
LDAGVDLVTDGPESILIATKGVPLDFKVPGTSLLSWPRYWVLRFMRLVTRVGLE